MAERVAGLTEVASILGVTRQRASQIARDYEDFPLPLAELAKGRVWDREAVEDWARRHPVRPPGRPRKRSVTD